MDNPDMEIITVWRQSIRVVTTKSPVNVTGESKQIEIQRFDKYSLKWVRIAYFRRLTDFDDFLNALDDAGDILENKDLSIKSEEVAC